MVTPTNTNARTKRQVATSPPERRVPGEHGIWVFVLGDMVFFALLFGSFMYSRGRNPDSFAEAGDTLSLTLGTLNTVLLLTSSLLVVLAVHRVLAGTRELATNLFGAALACGLGFVASKAVEWTHMFSQGHALGTGEFYTYYYMLTGTHLLHVLIGCVLLTWMLRVTRRPETALRDTTFCEVGGIFWHMVDLLWVVLFALFYLVR